MNKEGFPFFGESTCSKKECHFTAYYKFKGYIYCGRHAKRRDRTTLLKNPNAATIAAEKLKNHVISLGTLKKKGKGSLTCYKMRMMNNPPLTDGILLVFPNNRHQDRKDGFGCCSLSPMRLGPIKHGQLNAPDAFNLENYFQSNKCFEFEQKDGKPLKAFYEKRNAAYLDQVPHRHKYTKGMNPLFSIHSERVYNYIESRFFYCFWYTKLVKETADFRILKSKIENGYNLCICGYDAFQPTKDLYEHYCDVSKPFGHELVLYSLLTIEDVSEYPWTKYYESHKSVYDPLSF